MACLARPAKDVSLSRPADPTIVNIGRFESEPPDLEGIDCNRVENEPRIRCTHRRPEKSPGGVNYDFAAERIRGISKIRVDGSRKNTLHLCCDLGTVPVSVNEATESKHTLIALDRNAKRL